MEQQDAHVPPRLVGVTLGDEPDAWRAAGFHVDGDRFETGGVTWHLAGGAEERGVLGWQLEPAVDGTVDGLEHAEAGSLPPGRPPHPNGTTALDHLVVTTDDLERTTSALATIGLTPRRTIVGAQGDDELAYRFFLLGTSVLELIGPAGPTASSGAVPTSARAETLRRGGPRAGHGGGTAAFAGLAFTTDRIDELGELAPPPRPAVQPGRRITTLDHRALGISVPVALLSPRPGSRGSP
jgi:hypothetical protein